MQLLGSCSKAVTRSPRWVIIVFAIVFAVSASMMMRLRVSPDISALMPAHSRVSGALLEALEDFGATDRLILVIESTDAEAGPLIAERDKLKSLADRVAEGMADTGMFSSVAYRITADERQFFEDLHFRHPFHYHSPERLQELQQALNPQEIGRRVNDLRRTLRASPFGVSSQQQLLRDPLGFRSAPGTGYDHDNLTGLELDLSDGYFFSLDGTALLILAKPLAPSQDAAFDAALLDVMSGGRLVLGVVGRQGLGPAVIDTLIDPGKCCRFHLRKLVFLDQQGFLHQCRYPLAGPAHQQVRYKKYDRAQRQEWQPPAGEQPVSEEHAQEGQGGEDGEGPAEAVHAAIGHSRFSLQTD